MIIGLLVDDALGGTREQSDGDLDPVYLQAFARVQAEANQALLVVETPGEPGLTGTLQLTRLSGVSLRGATRGMVEAVRIATHLRGCGLGTTLMEDAEARLIAAGCTYLQLTSNESRTDAHRFYRKLGWQQTHLGFKKAVCGPS